MIADLAEGYQQGKTTTELSVEYNISKATICRALRKMGIEPERKDNLFTLTELTEEEKASIILDFRAGLKIKDLTRKYDYSYSVLVKLLEDNDLYTKKLITKTNDVTKMIKDNEDNIRKILSNQEQLELCEKFIDGPSSKVELAAEYSIHHDTVSAILRRHDALIKRYIADEVLDMICDDFKSGITIYSLSKSYNQSPITIKYWLTKRKMLATVESGVIDPNVPPSPKKKFTKAQLRELAMSDAEENYEILRDIARDPQAGTRNRITAIALMHERAYGKPKEEVSEEQESQSASAKILSMLPKKKEN